MLVFNTCTIREKPDTRFAAHLGARARAEGARPGEGDRRRRLLRRGAARAALLALPVRRRRLRAGLDPAPRRVARRRRRGRRRAAFGIAEERALRRRGCRCTASGASRRGCRSRWAATRCARTASSRRCAAARSRAGPARSSPRSSASPREGVREMTLLGQNVNSYGRDVGSELRASCCAPATRSTGIERIRFTSPHPKDFRAPVIAAMAECAARLRARAPAAPVGLDARAEGDAPHVLARALPAPRRRAARRDPGPRADDRPDRRLPRRDRGRLRGDARASSRRSATTAPSRSSTRRAQGTEAAAMPDQVPDDVKRERIERLVEIVQRVAEARNSERVGRVEEVLVEGPSRTDASLLRGRTRRNTTVNFAGAARAGRARSACTIEGATSTTLTRHRSSPPLPPSRDLVWDGCLNVRDLGGLPTVDGGETRFGAIVRADSVRQLSDEGWRALVELRRPHRRRPARRPRARGGPAGRAAGRGRARPVHGGDRRRVGGDRRGDRGREPRPRPTYATATRDVYLIFLERFKDERRRRAARGRARARGRGRRPLRRRQGPHRPPGRVPAPPGGRRRGDDRRRLRAQRGAPALATRGVVRGRGVGGGAGAAAADRPDARGVDARRLRASSSAATAASRGTCATRALSDEELELVRVAAPWLSSSSRSSGRPRPARARSPRRSRTGSRRSSSRPTRCRSTAACRS